MKTKSFAIITLTALLTGCSSNNTNNNSEKAEEKDSVQTEQIVEETAQPAVEEKQEMLITPDLMFCNLKGNVKKCTLYPSDPPYNSFTFDENGNITEISESYAKVTNIKRDGKGRITCLSMMDGINREYAIEYAYNADGTVAKRSCDALPDGLAHEFKYTYDDQGRVKKEKGWSDGPGEIEYRYEYTKVDEHGNWTERKRTLLMEGEEPTVMTEERKIEYFK